MSIIDKVGALLPWRRERHELAPARTRGLAFREPAFREPGGLAFRDDLDRWLQRLVEEPLGLPGFTSFVSTPPVGMHETDDEVVVTVEVPGVSRDDLDLMIGSEGLVIRGETRDEREDKRRDYRLVQARYGSFARTVPLPPGLDVDHPTARLKDGVLTVRFPKADTRPGMRRVPIKH
ncbi:MAG TPA: Hsp20/alpha crystallin family protein [Candidatus Binatia bacterium]|jgi:HSP20 family protein|nr:Hsp20/alpha crystallin family protein [Candidatus Binatia bacterium]